MVIGCLIFLAFSTVLILHINRPLGALAYAIDMSSHGGGNPTNRALHPPPSLFNSLSHQQYIDYNTRSVVSHPEYDNFFEYDNFLPRIPPFQYNPTAAPILADPQTNVAVLPLGDAPPAACSHSPPSLHWDTFQSQFNELFGQIDRSVPNMMKPLVGTGGHYEANRLIPSTSVSGQSGPGSFPYDSSNVYGFGPIVPPKMILLTELISQAPRPPSPSPTLSILPSPHNSAPSTPTDVFPKVPKVPKVPKSISYAGRRLVVLEVFPDEAKIAALAARTFSCLYSALSGSNIPTALVDDILRRKFLVSLSQYRNNDVHRLVTRFFWPETKGPSFNLTKCQAKVKNGDHALPADIAQICQSNREQCESLLKNLVFIYGLQPQKGIFHPVMEKILLYFWSDEYLEKCQLNVDAAKEKTMARYILRYAIILVSNV
jgi:hypothetical protein